MQEVGNKKPTPSHSVGPRNASTLVSAWTDGTVLSHPLSKLQIGIEDSSFSYPEESIERRETTRKRKGMMFRERQASDLEYMKHPLYNSQSSSSIKINQQERSATEQSTMRKSSGSSTLRYSIDDGSTFSKLFLKRFGRRQGYESVDEDKDKKTNQFVPSKSRKKLRSGMKKIIEVNRRKKSRKPNRS